MCGLIEEQKMDLIIARESSDPFVRMALRDSVELGGRIGNRRSRPTERIEKAHDLMVISV